ncbi:MAG TPA: DUF885 domain-containing protein [Thermoanaerobaculia bacterium]|nr:DUF885 domain-containing protein [Thermoanaerobaculia bacterium]
MKTVLCAIALLCANTLGAQELSASDLDRRRHALVRLLDEHWEYTMRTNPDWASVLGDPRFNDRLPDVSEAAVQADLAQTRRFLQRFEAIGTVGFNEQERLDRELMVRDLRQDLEAAKHYPWWLMPVSQYDGIHIYAPELPSSLVFRNARDYDDYVTRLGKYPRVFDDTIANMRKGMAANLMPPKFLLEKVAEQAAQVANTPAAQSPFAVPLNKFPEGLTEAEKERIRGAVLAAVEHSIIPAYRRFAAFVKDEYAPQGRSHAGIWSLPDGRARYAFRVRQQTTTRLTPDEIHQIGLREVARIEGEMLQIAKKLGHEDVKSLNEAIARNPDLKYKAAQGILDDYRRFIAGMYTRLPQFFGRLPKASVDVVPVSPFRERSASAAQYEPGAPDGSRPGRVHVNTYQVTARKTLTTESTAYHEGVPGHHMQFAIQQELAGLPKFRKHGEYAAFVEGWGLYAEDLAREAGAYEDPYSDYGRLNNEILRAIRLVADTGLHEKKWTREQVVQFFHDHSAIDEVRIQSEVDRYMVVPGQALAYKIGQLKIRELRERAQKTLGPRFDVRAFHDEILGAGALPLDVLEVRIESWMKRTMGTR